MDNLDFYRNLVDFMRMPYRKLIKLTHLQSIMPEREYYIWDLKGEEETWKKFYYFAESYKRACRLLLEKERNRIDIHHDEDILPALHLFTQYLELIFKCFLIKNGCDITSLIRGHKGHDIIPLYKKVSENLQDFSLNKESYSFIDDLSSMNINGQPFRYPTDTKGNSLWVHECEGRHFNLSGIYTMVAMVTHEIEQYIKQNIFSK